MVKLSAFCAPIALARLLSDYLLLVQYLHSFIAITESLDIPHVLTRLEFTLGVLCSISLAGAGYVINDLFDTETDQRNKPGRMVIGRYLSIGNAWVIYGLLNLLAIGKQRIPGGARIRI
ncbi:MAG: hypothetical protein U5L96_11500 [Owenweeksia sp.]|nr:hypothetical protein [Owenweeksia sp.]